MVSLFSFLCLFEGLCNSFGSMEVHIGLDLHRCGLDVLDLI
jgi:hypothetical protein